MIRYVVYLLLIFKMVHGLMNNPVLKYRTNGIPYTYVIKRILLFFKYFFFQNKLKLMVLTYLW
jgi:hypothetical protein